MYSEYTSFITRKFSKKRKNINFMSRPFAIWRLPCDSSLKLVETNNPFIRFQLIRKLSLTVVCRLQILANQFRQVSFP